MKVDTGGKWAETPLDAPALPHKNICLAVTDKSVTGSERKVKTGSSCPRDEKIYLT